MTEKTINFILKSVSPSKVVITYYNGNEFVDMTFKEFIDIVNEVKAFLLKFGIKKHDRVVIIAENHAKWLPMFIGITTYGAVVVPIDGQFTNSKLLTIIHDAKPKLIITSKQFEDKISLLFNDIKLKTTLTNFHFDLLQTNDEIKPESDFPKNIQPNDPALIVYTSGTTGSPKGIIHTHFSIMSSISHSLKIGNISTSDTVLTILPYTHVFGLINAALVPLYLGIKNVIAHSLNPIDLLSLISNLKVSYVCLVPRLAEILLYFIMQSNKKINNLKITIGGASINHKIIHKLRELGIKVGFGYGMTETCGGILNSFDAPIGSVGKAIPPIEIKILNPNNEGIGELLVSSPTNTSGIFGKPELNKTLWHDKIFLKTGDLAKIDENGYVYILGRIKDVIVPPCGMNVYPDELEERLSNLPFVKELCVLKTIDNNNEYPMLAIYPNEEYFKNNNILNIKEYIENKINELTTNWPDWEKFKEIQILNEPFPRSYSFKVQRNILYEIIANKKDIENNKELEVNKNSNENLIINEIFNKLKPIIANHLNISIDELSLYKPFSQIKNFDSLGKISLLAYLQKQFNLIITDVELANCNNFYSLINFLIKSNDLEKLKCFDINLKDNIFEFMPLPLDFSIEGVKKRQKIISQITNTNISIFENMNYENLEQYRGNIENLFGFCYLPLGIVGPIKVNGDYAKGEFYVPMATTEGALIASTMRGCEIINLCNGAEVKIISDLVHRTPIFSFNLISEMFNFYEWIKNNFSAIKSHAEATTAHGKLVEIEYYPVGTNLILRFSYNCADASGQNMVTLATNAALNYILSSYPGKIKSYFLDCNLSGDKKINAINFIKNRGKKVIANVKIPYDIIKTYLKLSPEKLIEFYNLAVIGTIQSHTFGMQAHYSNILTAIYIALGQDAACAAESAFGITQILNDNESIIFNVTLPGIMVGTVGGGTHLPTQKTCLEILGCYGKDNSKKLAEIIGACVLAGEISLTASMASGDFTNAHLEYGRKKK